MCQSALLVIFVFFISSIFNPYSLISNAYAQEALSVTQSYVIQGNNIQTGQIISATNNGYALSSTPYDTGMIGVVTENPAVSLSLDLPNSYPVAASGTAYVLVSNSNGSITKGDLITSSQTPGIGMKATQSGYILGSALEDYNSSSPGKILVSLNLRFAISKDSNEVIQKSLKDMLSLSTIAALENPTDIFKYVLSGFITLASILIAIFTFGRNGALGIEALGRNPRASYTIALGIVINVATSVSIIAAGLGTAYFILKL